MGYLGQQLYKNSPWGTFVIWCVLIGFICATCVTRDNFWWVLPLAIVVLVGVFFSCRTQARINKKLCDQNKSISDVSWTKNIQMHVGEMINSQELNKKAIRKQIMRLCAYSMVGDNRIVTPEKEKIVDCIKSWLKCDEQEAEKYFDSCSNSLKNSEIERQSLFVETDKLSDEEIERELEGYAIIANADGRLLDIEREAFRLICKLLKLNQTTRIWDYLSESHKAYPNTDKLKESFPKGFHVGSFRKKQINVEEFKKIERIISFYNITGPLVDAAKHVLQKEYSRNIEWKGFVDRQISKFSFKLFCILALILFLRLPACERGISAFVPSSLVESAVNLSNRLGDNLEEKMLVDLSALADSLTESGFHQDSSYANDIYITQVANYSKLIRDSKNVVVGSYVELEWTEDDIEIVQCCTYVIGCLLVIVVLLCFLGYSKKTKSGNALNDLQKPFLNFLNTTWWLLLFATILVHEIGILAMMISVEWLIFMRESNHSKKDETKEEDDKKHSYGMLITIVLVAIITDVAYAYANHSIMEHGHVGLSIIAAPLFLGSVCFLFGKWLEDNRANTEVDFRKMEDTIANLGKQ